MLDWVGLAWTGLDFGVSKLDFSNHEWTRMNANEEHTGRKGMAAKKRKRCVREKNLCHRVGYGRKGVKRVLEIVNK
jgi:hypothetical protein